MKIKKNGGISDIMDSRSEKTIKIKSLREGLSMSEKKILLKKIPTEIYSRVVGYYRPVQNWNEGKQQEFKERVYYNITPFEVKKSKNNTSVA